MIILKLQYNFLNEKHNYNMFLVLDSAERIQKTSLLA